MFFEEKFKKWNLIELESEITDRIHRHFHCDLSNSDAVPIECHFLLDGNCRTTVVGTRYAVNLTVGFENLNLNLNLNCHC